MRVNNLELAEIFDVTRGTISSWTKDGMPYVEQGGQGRQWAYDVGPCLEWWAENKFRVKKRSPVNTANPFDEGVADGRETIEEAERRKMVAQADKAELDLAKNAGKVVLIEDVAAATAELHTRVKTKLLGIGNQVRMHARAFFGEDREAEEQVVGAVEQVVKDALADLRDDAGGGEDESA